MPRTRATTTTGRRRMTIAIAAGVLILLGVAGVVIWRVTSGSAATTSTQRTVTVTEQTIKDTVGATGTVEPKHRADLSFASSGTVTSIKVAVGDKVSKGQKLAAIGDAQLQADLEAARADYQAAKDDLATAEDNSTTTGNELSAAKAKVAVQKSMVAQAKNALAAATLRSPFSGTVAAVAIAKGDTVGSATGSSGNGSSGNGSSSGGSSSGNGTSASSSADITVISKGTFTVATTVGSADLAKIKKGLQAEITVTGASTPIYGTVSAVAVMASSSGSGTTTSGSAATFDVTIDVTGTQKNLYAGASATVSIIVKQRPNVLTVPTAAISTANGKSMVQKVVNGKPVATEITVGESYGATTEVTKGLNAGDQVVITIANRIPTGTSTRTTTRGTGGGGGGGFNNGGFPNGQGQGQGQGQPQGNATGAGGTR